MDITAAQRAYAIIPVGRNIMPAFGDTPVYLLDPHLRSYRVPIKRVDPFRYLRTSRDLTVDCAVLSMTESDFVKTSQILTVLGVRFNGCNNIVTENLFCAAR